MRSKRCAVMLAGFDESGTRQTDDGGTRRPRLSVLLFKHYVFNQIVLSIRLPFISDAEARAWPDDGIWGDCAGREKWM